MDPRHQHPCRRFSITLRGDSVPSSAPRDQQPTQPQPTNPSLPFLESAVAVLLTPSSNGDVPPLSILTAQVYRAAILPDAPARVARSLSFFNIPFTSHDIDTLCEAAQHVRSADPAAKHSNADELSSLTAWNDDSAAVFCAAAIAAGAAKAVDEPTSPPPVQPEPGPQAPPPSVPPRASSSFFEPSWLRLRCSQLAAVSAGGGLSAAEMAASVLSLLTDASRTDDHLQGDLFDAFMGDFDAVSDVLSRRAELAANADAVVADCAQASDLVSTGTAVDASRSARGVKGRRRDQAQRSAVSAQITVRDVRQEALEKEELRTQRRLMKSGLLTKGQVEDEDDLPPIQALGGSGYQERQRFFPNVQLDGDSVIGAVDRVGLPRGSTREVGKGFEEIFVPPPTADSARNIKLVQIADALADHPELLQAMRGVTTLNRLQSSVYPAAFESDENLLVCAPTGAGKTNVALLTIFREILAVKHRLRRSFKVVYVAPMKALAAEVTEKFSSRLGPLGLRVREFTGDMSLSRVEALETHVLVTTPEKWDVVTRKSGSELGDAVTLFIVDEIHLLHDSRGAVLESIVARTLRLSETAQRQIRLVGLSATLPNYADVGSFMRVDPEKGLFHFDGSHRPVPLSQTFIGITEGGQSNSSEARRRREGKMHEMAWKKVKDSLQRGHQAMIFVHSRKGTAMAAREMIGRAAEDSVEDIFIGGESSRKEQVQKPTLSNGQNTRDAPPGKVLPTWAAKEISKSKSADVRELCAKGVGIHNAGLARPDRKLVEKLFADGIIRLLCCTATLAWGINLPARTVVIMGTEVYDAEKGGFVQLGMLDVMQIFGRAGRPQFDTEGEGTIITMHEHLGKYLSLLTSSIPIESQLGASASRLADHLNAEIVSGTVSSIGEGVRWLSYTYLSVRMPQNPLVYGIDWSEVEADSGLHSRRATLIEQASKALDDARMCRYDPRTGALAPSDLGRVSSHFYVSHETVVLWNDLLGSLSMEPAVTDADWDDVYATVLHAVSCATEFEQMRSRQEEAEELDYLTREACPIPLKSGSETREGKVAILLQAYISRAPIRMSDLSYVVQSCTRLLRALFEISLRRGLPSLSLASLELARASESRIWPFQHPLWQFTYSSRKVSGLMITPETVATLEASGDNGSLESLREMTRDELSVLVRAPKMSLTVQRVVRAVPTLQIVNASVAPLNRTVLSVNVSLFPNFRWNDGVHGKAESWWLWVEDHEEDRVYHSQRILLTKEQVRSLNAEQASTSSRPSPDLKFSFSVPVFDPPSSQYWLRVESEKWHTGGGSTAALRVSDMELPEEIEQNVELLDLRPLPVHSALTPKEASLFEDQISHFNPLQTQAFHTARYTDENILLAAPSGSGKIAVAEIAMLRAIHERSNATVVYIAPDRDSLALRQKLWQKLKAIVDGKLQVIDSRCTFPAGRPLGGVRVLLATPGTWNHFAQSWSDETIAEWISLVVLDELHLLSSTKHVGIDVAVARLRNIAMKGDSQSKSFPRLVALCEPVPNAAEVADWLGVTRSRGFFCFYDNVRQVSRESQVIGVAGDRYTSRMSSVNRTLFSMIQRYSPKKPILIYVSSRRQTLLTAQDLSRLSSMDGKENVFRGSKYESSPMVGKALREISDNGLKRCLSNGIGLYHENMNSRELEAVGFLFKEGHVQVMVATFEMARRVSFPSHLVVVKGTESYQPKLRRYEDIPVAEVLHMIGQAGRPTLDSVCYAIVFVHEPKKTLFKKFLHEALPIESAVHRNIPNILLKEIAAGRVSSCKDAVGFLTWSFLFRRLKTNPGYYGLKKRRAAKDISQSEARTEAAVDWCVESATSALRALAEKKCVSISEDFRIQASKLGCIVSCHGFTFETVAPILQELPKSVKMEDTIRMICGIEEVSALVADGYVEDAVWKNLCDIVCDKFCNANRFKNREAAVKGLGLTRCFESQEKRALATCYSLVVDGMTHVRVFGVDRVKLCNAFGRVLAAVFDIVVEMGTLAQVMELVKLSQCLYQGILPTDDAWVLSGYANERISRKGRESGYSTVSSVLKDEVAFSAFVAQNSTNEAQRSAILRWWGRRPRLSVVARRDDNGCNKKVLIDVEVRRGYGRGREGADTLSRVSEKREGGVVVVVGNKTKDKMFGVRRVADGGRESEKMSVVVALTDAWVEGEDIGVWVLSDVYVSVQAQAVVA